MEGLPIFSEIKSYKYPIGFNSGLPPEKWSSLKYGFLNPRGGIIDEQEAL
jgi:hypothetical protein